jgi:catechol 2,3-dioxygenase
MTRPIHFGDIAHLGHVEILTPSLDESTRFFIDLFGMTETFRSAQSVYLKGWDDYEIYTLKLTASVQAGIGHLAFRTSSKDALENVVARIQASGAIGAWIGEDGQGDAFRFSSPDGHPMEVYYETRWFEAPPELKPSLQNQSQRVPGRGANVRRIDHLNLFASDVAAMRAFLTDVLGLRMTEQTLDADGLESGCWVTSNNKSYDLAVTRDPSGARGRFHHVTYAVDSRDEVIRAADLFRDNGVMIEMGPYKHTVQQSFFVYVYEPGGNRVEVVNTAARLVLAPDWKPIVWTHAETQKRPGWGMPMVDSFWNYGTPPVSGRKREEP